MKNIYLRIFAPTMPAFPKYAVSLRPHLLLHYFL
jgi:hypothetical protein